ncbi:MAG TPA: AAA family ATPase [bacterium]|nr:AAA family ATPase [bacterium]
MRIRGLRLDGFGLFCGQQIDDVPPGLCVFFGDNEAGKSTLLAFIRSMLFGFPGGKANRYEPLRGGNYGGSLALLTDAGEEYVVRRTASRKVAGEVSITCPDGSAAGEDFMPNLLGSATRDLFESIFAFSLMELQELSKLTSEKVKGVIYSAGMGSLRRSLPALYAELDNRMSEIFKKGGRTPEINQVLKDLDNAGNRLRAIEDATGRYDDLKGRFSQSEEEIERLEQKRRDLSLRLKALERCLMAWDPWIALESARSELEKVPVVERFLADGLAELKRLQQGLEDAKAQFGDSVQRAANQKKKLEQIDVDEPLLAQANAIHRLQKGRDRYDDAVRDLPAREQEYRDASKRLSDKLSELGPDWDREKLLSFDVSVGRRESIRDRQGKLEDAREKESDARNSLNAATRAAETALIKADELRGAFEAIPEPPAKEEKPLLDRKERLKEIERLLGKRLRHSDLVENLKKREADLQTQTLPWQAGRNEPSRTSFRWLSFLAPVAGIVVAASTFRESAALAITVLVVGLILGYILHRAWRQQRVTDALVERQIEQVESRIRDIQHERETTVKELENIEASIRQNKSLMGIEYQLDESNIERETARAESALEECRDWRKASSEWEASQRAADEGKRQVEAAAKKHDDALKVLNATRAEWREWLVNAGLSENLSHSGALEVLSGIDTCRTIDDEAQKLSNRIELMSSVVHKYSDDVGEIARACLRQLRSGDDPGVFLDALSEDLRRAEENKAMREKIEESLSETTERVGDLHKQIGDLESSIRELLESGGAASVEEFQERAKWYERRQKLEDEARRNHNELQRIAGPGKLEELEARLRASSKDELEVERDDLKEELEQVDKLREEMLDRRGSLRKELAQLEAEDESSELRLREQELKAKLDQVARRWCVLRISREILRQAQDIYERERQPGVVREASLLFEKMTHGRYARIIRPLGEKATFDVLTPRQERREISQLSQGTKEQLFLALRFGLVQEFAQKHESLPLVMDDVLVNFDYHRARATAEVIYELAKTHQVLLFSCHQETLELVRKVAPGTQVFTLSDGTVKRGWSADYAD